MKCHVLTFLQKYLLNKCPSLFIAQNRILKMNCFHIFKAYVSYIIVIDLQTSQCTEYYNIRILL